MATMEAQAPVAADGPLTLHVARRYIDRALAKAKELRQCGSFAAVDAAGNVVSISKMDGAPAASAGVT